MISLEDGQSRIAGSFSVLQAAWGFLSRRAWEGFCAGGGVMRESLQDPSSRLG